ncbi:UDP-4-amino-4,6-dideoxy-N-acetyl-beta-L-altrosamine transaminase [Lewinella marina]|uniref:UDP-4-amino-4, 6-dideoxy-N-acetyl-beta-L-altrosamine transaminase n=1 Tax=Neolewinella marina TaxID=438751 RepID=A0A2G0CBW8_9BACT|nr:UDP-4-amino-4,6-dideoxy-N-acetyl-beta-L-altrosamine transaminase [Neolewinella marina]NJB86665.1 UDP-4-amino-4,6-dideoxy-N-acetyl-beta-L-altrosamine transaminase [Neolewinella marina]PHK97473.1 UDP-4-amino-4,6-dideoxy-N-acetyl-beta-L-altrosamine transaminase [Neolewinella marina]
MSNYSIPYGKQDITEADIAAVVEALKSDYLTTGPRVEEFEVKFAEYIGAEYAVAVANGTAALHLCALALGVEPGKRVITTPITFSASANCVRYCGGEVWFADIDPETLTLDIDRVRELIESKPAGFFAGIIPVDFAGYPVDLEAFRKLADEHGLWIIEDACHAPGGWFTDSKGEQQWCGNGNYADLAIFSFHPVKHIASGEGGMITTNNRELYERLSMLRTHGITRDRGNLRYPDHGGWYMEMQQLGYNYRIPDILCALGTSQLSRAKAGMQRRQEIAQRYDEAFQGAPGILKAHGVPASDIRHAFHLYVIEVADRRGLYDYLREQNIYAQVHYVPVHTMPYYQDIGYNEADLSRSEEYYAGGLSLPMYPTLTEEEQDHVIAHVKAFIGG